MRQVTSFVRHAAVCTVVLGGVATGLAVNSIDWPALSADRTVTVAAAGAERIDWPTSSSRQALAVEAVKGNAIDWP